MDANELRSAVIAHRRMVQEMAGGSFQLEEDVSIHGVIIVVITDKHGDKWCCAYYDKLRHHSEQLTFEPALPGGVGFIENPRVTSMEGMRKWLPHALHPLHRPHPVAGASEAGVARR